METKVESVHDYHFLKVWTYILLGIFVIRLYSYNSSFATGIVGLTGSGLTTGKFVTFLSLIISWLEFVGVYILFLSPFFDLKRIKFIRKYALVPIFGLNVIFLMPICLLLKGNFKVSLFVISYAFEAIIGLVLSIFYLFDDEKLPKVNKKDLFKIIGIFFLLMIPAMPSYTLQGIFGFTKAKLTPIDLTIGHRFMLYFLFIIPVVLYFSLRNKDFETRRYTLIYISVATMVVFAASYDYTLFIEPWSWPFHLCNTAMFIIPLVLIFRMKKFFYFTYFINVFGALLAMLMPNYSSSVNILSYDVFYFWYNHYIACFMPILLVSLGMFEKPKLKSFIYSMIGFLAYFILVLILNVVFTAMGHEVDYFFINSTFIAEKMGAWAENMFNITLNFNAFGLTFTFHPIYQIVYFFGYVLLGLGVWFVYSEAYRIAERHYELHLRLQTIKQYEYAKNSIPKKEELEKMKDENIEAYFELKNFSKKYASNKKYAVTDASLRVEGGEIFGFLGPNGAGKSTIIKSLVGIQPISEGNIEVCGFDVKGSPVASKYNIGYVPDHYALYEQLTGREYINYIADIYEVSKEDREERIEKYIKLFELENNIDSKIKTYSHGMKQKITIMAALVHNPKVWILDEPLTGLDPNSIYQVKECMKEHAKQGNVVFFSSHIIDIVEKLCNRIAIIKHGHILCIKTIEEIEAENPSLEEFYLKMIAEGEDE